MSQNDHQYFMIPFANLPKNPDYTVWFASWSTTQPDIEPGMYPPVVVGVTTGRLPAGAIPLATTSKDPPPCLPPLPPLADVAMSDYQKSVSVWLELSRVP